jgi:hypothetical protein
MLYSIKNTFSTGNDCEKEFFEALPAFLSSLDETLLKFTGKPPTNID